jgi:hypothetical protein
MALALPSIVHAGGHFPPMRVDMPGRETGRFAAEMADDWYLKTIHAAAAGEISTGEGIVVALLDSGVDTDHPALAGHLDLTLGRNFADVDDPHNVEDGIGHGTTMAGLILQVAPDAKIIPLKINAGSSPNFTNQALLDALEYLRQLAAGDPRIRVANLSVVVDESEDDEVFTAAINALAVEGVMLAVAGGNQGDTRLGFPANLSMTLGVTAVDAQDQVAGFANQGPSLVIASPGDFIHAPTLGGGYGYMSGTSPATALVSGALAVLAAKTVENNGILWALLAGSRDLFAPGHDDQSGFGRLDVGAAAREMVTRDIYSLPTVLLVNVGAERSISFAPAGAKALVPAADAPFVIVAGERDDNNTLTIRGRRPGNGFLNIEWQGFSRAVPVTVVSDGIGSASSCRVGHFFHPRYQWQAESGESLWGFCAVQCLEPMKTDGCWWTNYWQNGGYCFHCLSAWKQLDMAPGETSGNLFPPLPLAAVAPGIYEMGISLTGGFFSDSRSFFVNLY